MKSNPVTLGTFSERIAMNQSVFHDSCLPGVFVCSLFHLYILASPRTQRQLVYRFPKLKAFWSPNNQKNMWKTTQSPVAFVVVVFKTWQGMSCSHCHEAFHEGSGPQLLGAADISLLTFLCHRSRWGPPRICLLSRVRIALLFGGL